MPQKLVHILNLPFVSVGPVTFQTPKSHTWLITTILDSAEIVEIKSEPYCTYHSNKNKFQVNSGLNLRNKVIKILEENMQHYAYLALVSSFYPPAMPMADKGLISVCRKSFGKLVSE